MTEAVQEKEMAEWSKEEKETLIQSYGCNLVLEKATPEQIKDKSLPSDTLQVVYRLNDQVYTDLCRGKRVDVFDLYYDKFGKGALIRIEWAYGQVNPKLWAPKKKRNERRNLRNQINELIRDETKM